MSKWHEKDFEESMRPHIDNIYRDYFGRNTKIVRSFGEIKDKDGLWSLDRDFGIDALLSLEDGAVVSFQEKTLRFSKRQFKTYNIEYMSDPDVPILGEWFYGLYQFYFLGYATEDCKGYHQYWIIDMARVRLHLSLKLGIEHLKQNYLKVNRPPAKANFFAIPLSLFPNDVIVYDSGIKINKSEYF